MNSNTITTDEIIPTKDKRVSFMKAVYAAADLSKDPRTKIGAVIVRGDDLISSGYNNFPRGVKDLRSRYENREEKYPRILHGEHNAILSAAKRGVATEGTTIYTNGVPCSQCMLAIINSGIKKVVVHKQWPELTHVDHWIKSTALSREMASEAGVEIEVFDQELGLTGLMDGKEIIV